MPLRVVCPWHRLAVSGWVFLAIPPTVSPPGGHPPHGRARSLAPPRGCVRPARTPGHCSAFCLVLVHANLESARLKADLSATKRAAGIPLTSRRHSVAELLGRHRVSPHVRPRCRSLNGAECFSSHGSCAALVKSTNRYSTVFNRNCERDIFPFSYLTGLQWFKELLIFFIFSFLGI